MPVYMDILNYMFIGENGWIKVLLVGHFSLTTLGAIGSFQQNIYLFYNFPLILLLFLSIRDKKSKELLQLVMMFELFSMVMDIVHIGFQIGYLSKYTLLITYFSLLLALIHLGFRPFAILYLLQKKNEIQSSSEGNESNDEEELGEISENKNPFEA